jgi:hypothetical protein
VNPCPGWLRDVPCGQLTAPGSKWCESCTASVKDRRKARRASASVGQGQGQQGSASEQEPTSIQKLLGVVILGIGLVAFVGCSVAVFGGDDDDAPARDEGPSYSFEECQALRVVILSDKTYSESERSDAAADFGSYCQ